MIGDDLSEQNFYGINFSVPKRCVNQKGGKIMNNKLFARIMTAVICICMMSTVVFAADPVLTIDGNTATMSFLVGTEGADISKNTAEDQITMMAYLVDEAAEAVPAYTDQKIVAINQVAGAAGFGNVLIDASKLETGKKIAVVLGGSDGTTESFFAVEETPAPTTYTATFVCEVETVEAMTGNAEGATIELPAVPEKSGFTGVWNDGTTDYAGGATYTFAAADVTFTAVYTAIPATYTVTFDANGGAFADATATKVFEEVAENTTLADVLGAIAAPAKAEDETNTYAFAGWFTAAEGGEPVDLATAVATDVTVYAQYTATAKPVVPQTVTVTLNGNGGLFGEATTLAVEVAANATFADVLASATYVEPVKTKTNAKGDKLDWAFVGWYTNEACETAVDLAATVSATNLYAKFVKVYIVGDANEDGVVNATDYAQIKLYYRSTATPKVNTNFPAIGNLIPDNAYTVKKTDKSEVVYKVGDINGDGNVNATDYAQVKLYYRSTSSPKENANFVTIGKAVTIKKD